MPRIMRRICCSTLALACALALHAQTTPVALTGTLVTPDQIIDPGTILIQNGHILAAGKDIKLPPNTKTIATNSILAPGLIDLHNHLTWNVFPRWKPTQEFGNRYDWQQKPIYQVLLEAPHQALAAQGLECQMERYAELKAITEGETSVTGSMHNPCVHGLARNLDEDSELTPPTGKVTYNVFPFQMSASDLAAAKATLTADPRGSLLIHVAEGAPHDASAAREFAMLKARGLLLPGVSLIHAVALTPSNFAEMAQHQVGLIWSPRSNLELYGDTANVSAAHSAGVRIALAPDWSPSGSDGLLGELTYASLWNQTQSPPPFTERDLVLMATENAAALVNLQDRIGTLAAGREADILVIRKTGNDAYWSLTHARPQDLELVLIAGQPIYGDPALMTQLTTAQTETLTICNTPKAAVLTGPPFAETEHTLDQALHHYGRTLAPLAECGQ